VTSLLKNESPEKKAEKEAYWEKYLSIIGKRRSPARKTIPGRAMVITGSFFDVV
jgi:hypothetical protein